VFQGLGSNFNRPRDLNPDVPTTEACFRVFDQSNNDCSIDEAFWFLSVAENELLRICFTQSQFVLFFVHTHLKPCIVRSDKKAMTRTFVPVLLWERPALIRVSLSPTGEFELGCFPFPSAKFLSRCGCGRIIVTQKKDLLI